MNPSIGRIVIYRSRTGAYSVPAIVTATFDTLNPAGVQAGHIADLTSDRHVHLTVLTPGKPGKRGDAKDFVARASEPISENVAGCYQEWNVPWAGSRGGLPLDTSPGSEQKAGTWAWPL